MTYFLSEFLLEFLDAICDAVLVYSNIILT